MPRMWCISCQTERDHQYVYCQGACGGNCQHKCSVCGRETLASITVNTTDTGYAAIKQVVGEAQRRARDARMTAGEIEVRMESGNAFNGTYQCQVLVYNIQTGNYRINR